MKRSNPDKYKKLIRKIINIDIEAVVNSSILVLIVASPLLSGLEDLKYNLFTSSAKLPASSLLVKSISAFVVSNEMPYESKVSVPYTSLIYAFVIILTLLSARTRLIQVSNFALTVWSFLVKCPSPNPNAVHVLPSF